MSLVSVAKSQIQFARQYTLQTLAGIEDELWFQQPDAGVTHIAWQVGHLAMAEYGLTMLRIRGKEPEDQELISNSFFKHFKKGSTPNSDPSANPTPAEIRAVLGRVHERAMQELDGYSEQELEVKLPEPHVVFDTKLGSLFFCSAHEMLHAGQIGLIRRLLGKPPLR